MRRMILPLSRRLLSTSLVAVVLATSAIVATAQPQRDGVADRERRAPNAEQLRERLDQRIKHIEAERDRLVAIRGRLDAGTPVEEIIDELAKGDRAHDPPVNPDEDPDASQSIDPEELLALLKERAPEMGRRLEDFRANSPERFQQFIESDRARRLHGRLTGANIGRGGAEEDRLTPRLRAIARRAAEGDQEARAELRAHIAKGYEARRAGAQEMLAKLRARIAEVETDIAGADLNREEIIDRHLEGVLQRVHENPDAFREDAEPRERRFRRPEQRERPDPDQRPGGPRDRGQGRERSDR